MKKTGLLLAAIASLITLSSCSETTREAGNAAPSEAANEVETNRLEMGRQLAFDRTRGNCLSCHMISDGEQPGNIGPPLIQMKSRYPDSAVLRAQIWDSTAINPETVMPPYGKNKILTEEEIDMVVDFLLSI